MHCLAQSLIPFKPEKEDILKTMLVYPQQKRFFFYLMGCTKAIILKHDGSSYENSYILYLISFDLFWAL